MLYQPKSSFRPGVKVFLWIMAAVLCYLLYAFALQVYRISQVDIQYQNTVRDNARLADENERMKQLIAYLKTDDYREKEQKRISNLVNPGEKAVIIEGEFAFDDTGDPIDEARANWEVLPNHAKWWNFLFDEEEPQLRRRG